MTSIEPDETLRQINAAREQTHANLAVSQGHVALANDAAEAAVDAAAVAEAAADLSLRVDTTVGTRVFVGDTMIHGDTGWRSLPLIDNWAGVCRVRRMGSFVEVRLEDVRKVDTSIQGVNVISLPVGFRLTNPASLPSTGRVPFVINNSGGGDSYAYIAANGVYLRVTETSGNSGNAILAFVVDQAWPTSLPGSPV